MSDVKKEMPAISLLDQLRMQHASFVQQKDLAQNNLNQLVGAIYACEIMIKKHEEVASNLGDQGNGETDKQPEEQTAKK